MKAGIALALGMIVVSCLSGCATPQQYNWGTYQKSLYSYYKNPATAPDFVASLQQTINGAEHSHSVVPPGIYAEYGYLMQQEGNREEAIAAFHKEETQWPESKPFMDRMIQVASNNMATGSAAKEP